MMWFKFRAMKMFASRFESGEFNPFLHYFWQKSFELDINLFPDSVRIEIFTLFIHEHKESAMRYFFKKFDLHICEKVMAVAEEELKKNKKKFRWLYKDIKVSHQDWMSLKNQKKNSRKRQKLN